MGSKHPMSSRLELSKLYSLPVKGYASSQVYENADIDKLDFIKSNKCKSGIYMWTYRDSGKNYVGSSINISSRFNSYYSLPYLIRRKSSHICNALSLYGYSSFSITILEYIDISNLSKDQIKVLILEREQYYLNNLSPEYNILKIAGTTLGFKHSEIAKLKMGGKNNPMFGKTGEKNPFFGKTLSIETLINLRKPKSDLHKLKLSKANSGKKGIKHLPETLIKLSNAKRGLNHPMFGKIALNAKKVYVYSLDNKFIKECSSISEVAKWLNSYPIKINRCISTNKAFEDKYLFRLSKVND
jgi:group I intron endonuclease